MIQEDLSDDAIRLGVLVNTEQSRRLDRAITGDLVFNRGRCLTSHISQKGPVLSGSFAIVEGKLSARSIAETMLCRRFKSCCPEQQDQLRTKTAPLRHAPALPRFSGFASGL
jgi:hypothetical protein